MRINTSEFGAENVDDLEISTAVKVEMDDIQVVDFDKEDEAGDTLLYTEGVGPCITIIMVGKVKETTAEERPEQKFVAMYHWDGGSKEEIQTLSNLSRQECGKELAKRCLARVIEKIESTFCDTSEEEHAEYKITIDDIAILGGERARENLSGTEMQVRGLRAFLSSVPAKSKFKHDHNVELPELDQSNLQVFKASDTINMDVYVGLDVNSKLQVQYVMQHTVSPQLSGEEAHDSEEDVDDHDRDPHKRPPSPMKLTGYDPLALGHPEELDIPDNNDRLNFEDQANKGTPEPKELKKVNVRQTNSLETLNLNDDLSDDQTLLNRSLQNSPTYSPTFLNQVDLLMVAKKRKKP